MKKLTYTTVFEDKYGNTLELDQWSYKRLDTCIDALVKLYKHMYEFPLVKETLAKATKVATYYKTGFTISTDNKVSEIDIATFIEMIHSSGEKTSIKWQNFYSEKIDRIRRTSLGEKNMRGCMKQQTYMTVFEDELGNIFEFEWWSYKRFDTCINALVKLYKYMYEFTIIEETLAKATKVATYKTSSITSADNKVSEIDIATFIEMINSHHEKIDRRWKESHREKIDRIWLKFLT